MKGVALLLLLALMVSLPTTASAMRFLVLTEAKNLPPIPPEKRLELLERQAKFMLDHKDKGITVYGNIVGKKGSFAIIDAKTPEEADALIRRMPLFPYMEVQVYPVTGLEHFLESIKKARGEFKRRP